MSRSSLDRSAYLEHVRDGAERLARIAATGPADAPIAACPEWDLAGLVRHVGTVHRWAATCIREVRAPTSAEMGSLPPFDPAHPSTWYRDCVQDLVEELATLDPTTPTWHPFPVAQVGAFWPRRQAHEIAVHLWDAGHAVGSPPELDPVLASDGIDEYLGVVLPRLVAAGRQLPAGSVTIRCTDVEGSWWVTADGVREVGADVTGDAVVRGPAAQLLLRLWGRPGPDEEIVVTGDTAVADAWTTIGGN